MAVVPPEQHWCELSDLDYLEANGRLYRVVCKVCGRSWSLRLVPDRYKEGKLVGFWSCSHVPPRRTMSMREWWNLTDNGFEIPPTPADLALKEERKRVRLATENDPYRLFDEWKNKGGKLPRWRAQ